MSALDVFQYGAHQVRTVVLDGEPWFIAGDLAAILGYSSTAAMTRTLDEDEKGVHSLHTPGGDQQVTIINEPGMYSAVLRSRVEGAKQFRWWLTHDVLPAIRRTGRYGSDVEMLAALPSSKLLSLAAEAAARAEVAEAQLAVDAPKARSWDDLADASGTYTVSDAGKLLASGGVKTGPRSIFGQMSDAGWLFRRGGIWTGYQDKINAGLLAEVASSHRHPRTAERVLDAPQVRVTVSGLHALRALFGADQPLAGLDVAAVAS